MKFVISILFFLQACVFAAAVDYDCIVIGTSPFSMLEALYQHHSGQRVLILDEANCFGGAWKSISICGLGLADMGCHQIGNQQDVEEFLEEYVGCRLVSLDDPNKKYCDRSSFDSKGFYPSKGCKELIKNLENLIKATEMKVLLQHPIESIYLNEDQGFAEVKSSGNSFTTSKIVLTSASHVFIENLPGALINNAPCKTQHFHMYLLVADPTPPRFTYEENILDGVRRGSNLTWYMGLEGSGVQLIVLQTNAETSLIKETEYFELLKQKNYLDSDAKLICKENYIYEQCHIRPDAITMLSPAAQQLFQFMNTYNLAMMSSYINRWKQVLKPYKEAVQYAVY